ncbi:MAG: adenylate/guanylate cyclase domain-containing protein [Rhizobiaceae bacterium]
MPFRVSIVPSIFGIVLTIALGLAAAIILFTRHQNHEQAVSTADMLMDQSNQLVHLQIEGLIKPIESVVKRAPFWPEIGNLPAVSGHPTRDLQLLFAQDHPHISSTILGFEGGDFYQIGRAEFRPKDRLEKLGAPDGTVFLEKVILRSNRANPMVVDKFLDGRGNILGTSTKFASNYDPSKRPWYISAQETGAVTTSGIYVFSGSGEPGITVSKQFPGGVVGADITLAELNRFLKETLHAEEGILLIANHKGEILANSWSDDPSADSTTEPGVQTDFDGLAAEITSQLAGKDHHTSRRIHHDGREWLVRSSEIRIGSITNEVVVVGMPIDVVISDLNRLSRHTLLISLAILLASIPVIWLISQRISRPIRKLSSAVDKIRDFKLDSAIANRSIIREISSLESAVERMRLNLKTFGLYVPKALVQQLADSSSSPQLGGEARDITVLFMDMENFTAMSADLDPQEVMERMSHYFEISTGILLKHDATIDKYIGDAVMAFWNAPQDVPRHVGAACNAALEILEAADKATADWALPGMLPVRTRIGIHCGSAVIGNVGSSDRMNYTALGATVNLAARLEDLNRERGTSILVSDDIKRRAGDEFVFKDAGSEQIKGFDGLTPVYELIGKAGK